MQEADEQDTCRICSAPAEPDQPLFHPCKCSGTIRYIHQDCLTTWLAHSKKKNCDVCKHPYTFTKVYAPDMPSSLPPLLLFRRLLQQVFFALLFVLRGIAVAAIWLGVLPWVTVWTWRMYFSMGESAAWWISDRPRPPTVESNPFYNKIRYEAPASPPKNLVARVSSHPVWLALSADIFTGQIIASLIVLTFVAVFLLREWIAQNARPGVFEEEELPEDPAVAQPAQPEQAQPHRPPVEPLIQGEEGFPERAQLNQQQIEAIRALERMRHNLDPEVAMDPDRWFTTAAQAAANRRKMKKRQKTKKSEDREEGSSSGRKAGGREQDPRVEIEAMRRKAFHRHIDVARTQAARRRSYTSPFFIEPPSPPLQISNEERNFRFIFQPRSSTPPSNLDDSQASTSTSAFVSESPPSTSHRTSTPPPPLEDIEPSSPFPSVTLQPPSGVIPFSLSQWAQQSSSTLPPPPVWDQRTSSPPPEFSDHQTFTPPSPPPPWDEGTSNIPSLQPSLSSLSRPPLVTSSLLPSGSNPPYSFNPNGKAPISSPGLSTYRAPEELQSEAGPSRLAGYFENQKIEDNVEFDEEYEGSYDTELMDDEVGENGSDGYEGAERRFGAFGEEQPGPSSSADMEMISSDSDVDMEAERNWYFHTIGEDEEGRGDRVKEEQGPPRLFSLSDSDDTDEEGEHLYLEDEEGGDGEEAEREEDDEMFRDGQEDEEGAGGEGLFDDDDGPWEDEPDPVQPAQGAAAAAAGGAGAGGPAPPNAAQGAANPDQEAAAAGGPDLGEDGEGNGDDDLEGAMEAIGMRGPIYGVFQNAALMIFVLDTAIGLGIWIPFTIGKTTALLTLDPRRLLQVLHLPIKGMRIVTDPFVDFFAYIIVDLFFPWILKLTFATLRVLSFFGKLAIDMLLGRGTTSGISQFSMKLYNQSANLLSKPLSHISAWTASSNVTEEIAAAPNSTTPAFMTALPDYLGFTEPYFEVIGRNVRTFTTDTQESWIRLALGDGAVNRVFAISLGYCVVCILILLYLNILTVGNARSAGIAVRNAVRQQLLVIKVAAFIFIELVTFPLGCGIVLDLCTVWLFPEANLQSRMAFFSQAPLTAMFYHWVAGTMFMYSFAVLLSGCRSVMRPGAMWFIKDPQDQNSHPIRDILDRPALTQLRKICVSGLMYSVVVALVVGSVAGLVLLGSKSIMPFRWKNREPLSNVPVDLLFLHLVLPYTMHYLRPKRTIKSVALVVWKYLATRLRLTSYFFGGRHPIEECTPKHWKDNFRRGHTFVVNENEVIDGTFRRVPATDNLALPRDMRATVAVTEDGEPVDDAARELMKQQDAEAEKAKRNIKEDYMIVYMPPRFRYRIFAFIALFWMFGAVVMGIAVAVPVQLGRSFFRLFTPRDVHDGYSFIAGFYLLWACYLTAKAIDRLDKRRQRRSGDGPRAELPVLVLKRGLLWMAKTAYMVFFLGIVIPVLLALVIDLHIILPIRFTLDPGMTPRVRIVDMWALGLLYAKIAMHAHRIQPPNRITRGLQHIKAHGWTRPDPVSATKEVIAPLVGGLLGMILLPGGIFRALQHFLPNMSLDNRYIFMHVYPTVFIFAGTFRSAITLYGMLSSWSQAIRDKEFLVEMRLRNHEPESTGSNSSASTSVGPDTEMPGLEEARPVAQDANVNPIENPAELLVEGVGER